MSLRLLIVLPERGCQVILVLRQELMSLRETQHDTPYL
jgi:hypothetical protein